MSIPFWYDSLMNQSNAALAAEIRRVLGDRSQSWLAERAGVGQATVSRLLRGVYTPAPETLQAIGRALGIDHIHLMRLAGVPLPPPTDELDPEAVYIARRITELPGDIRAEAIDAIAAQVDAFHNITALYELAQRLTPELLAEAEREIEEEMRDEVERA